MDNLQNLQIWQFLSLQQHPQNLNFIAKTPYLREIFDTVANKLAKKNPALVDKVSIIQNVNQLLELNDLKLKFNDIFNDIYNNFYLDVVLSDSGGIGGTVHASGGSSDAIGGASDQVGARLQRQKVGSRKTFKFRKTRKDVSNCVLDHLTPVKDRHKIFIPVFHYPK